jgi:DNA primase
MLNPEMRNRIYEYSVKRLGMREYVRGWLKGTCPSCGRSDKFGINIGMNRTNCFVCGYHPTPIILITEVETFSSISETHKFLKTSEGLRYLEPVVERVERKEVKLPEGYINIAMGKSIMAKNIRAYVYARGFDLNEVALKGWGYCTEGKYLGYLILPFYTAGELTYYNGRRVCGLGPKYQNPQIEEFGIGKSLILYNADALAMYEEVYILEGVLNAETLGDNALATGGKEISDYQISLINKSPIKRVVVVLDPDAFDNAIRIGLQLTFHKEVKLVTWDGDDDVNDIGKEETMKRIDNSRWLSYNDILKLKNEKGTKHTYYQE